MSPAECEAAQRLLGLKDVKRTGWLRFLPCADVESVADHSYGVMLLAWLLCPDNLDRTRVLELAMIHDLAELVTGDRTPHEGLDSLHKAQQEEQALAEILEPFACADTAQARLREYNAGKSPEARWVKAVDKLDMTLQSRRYEQQHGVGLGEFRESSKARLASQGMGWVVDRL